MDIDIKRLTELKQQVFDDFQLYEVKMQNSFEESMKEVTPTGEMDDDGKDLMALIDAEIARQWVSVSERLPEREGNYLCCDDDTMVIFAADYDASGWQRPFIAPFYREVTITHWKPLPEPPKGE